MKKMFLKTMSTFKKALPVALPLVLVCSSIAFAGDDPFEGSTDKVNDVIDKLLPLIAGICTLAIMGFGVAMMLGKISQKWGLGICGGCLIVGGAAGFASYFMG